MSERLYTVVLGSCSDCPALALYLLEDLDALGKTDERAVREAIKVGGTPRMVTD